jgi:anti-anti-sigma factor
MHAIQRPERSFYSSPELSVGASPIPWSRTHHQRLEERGIVGRHDTIQVEAHSATASIVTLRGEHDLSSAARIAAALRQAGARGNVLVDLSQCDFMDSSVISALFRASGDLQTRGGRLALVIPDDRHGAIRSLFELMSLARLIPTHATRAAAIADLDTAQGLTDAPARTRLRSLGEIIDQSLPDAEGQRRAS